MRTGVLAIGEYAAPRLVTLCQLAEALGYDFFWYADERFFREVYSGLACCALNTSRIRLGPCVTDPYSRHPALTAVAIGTLDEISGGRAVLGVGAGVSGFAELGILRERPAVAIREAIQLVRRLLVGGTVDFQGEIVRFHHGHLHFRPPRSEVPIYVASNAPAGQKVAGQLGDGAIMQGCVSDRALESFFSHLRAGAARAGRGIERVDVVARINTCIHSDGRAAREVMKPTIARGLIAQQPKFQTLAAAGIHVPERLREMVRGYDYRADEAVLRSIAEHIPDAFVDALTFAGRADEVAAQVIRMAGRGITQFMIYPMAPDGDIETQVRVFAEQVMPEVQQQLDP